MSLPKREGEVFCSTDYDLLKPDPENRDLKEFKVEKLINSMQQVGFLKSIPIVVDKNYMIKAGQHRLEAAKRLKIPYWWMIDKNITMAQIRVAESTGNTAWNPDDWGSSFAKTDLPAYIVYQQFRQDFPLIPAMMAIIILSGANSKKVTTLDEFKAGHFKVVGPKRAWELAELIYQLKDYYEGWTKRNFIMAMLKVLKNPKFEWPRFLRKLKYKHLRNQATIEDYLADIEAIYNFNERNKINLRF